jgi:hypothetical protein
MFCPQIIMATRSGTVTLNARKCGSLYRSTKKVKHTAQKNENGAAGTKKPEWHKRHKNDLS